MNSMVEYYKESSINQKKLSAKESFFEGEITLASSGYRT